MIDRRPNEPSRARRVAATAVSSSVALLDFEGAEDATIEGYYYDQCEIVLGRSVRCAVGTGLRKRIYGTTVAGIGLVDSCLRALTPSQAHIGSSRCSSLGGGSGQPRVRRFYKVQPLARLAPHS
jgi:hypothetical protein